MEGVTSQFLKCQTLKSNSPAERIEVGSMFIIEQSSQPIELQGIFIGAAPALGQI